MTFISYPNLIEVSSSGQYRIEIEGMFDEDGGFRDRHDFCYKLFFSSSTEQAWTWKPSVTEDFADFPHAAWVNDMGWVVVRLHEWFHAGILVLSPVGHLTLLRCITGSGDGSEGLLADEPDIRIGGGSAGPSWEMSSIAVFHEYESRPYWSIRTWWGRRIVIELESGTVVEEIPDAQIKLIEERERDWIFRSLSQCASLSEPDDRWSRRMQECYSAAYHAGLLQIRDTEPYLRLLERSNMTGGSSCEYWYSYQSLPLRLVAKMSLLRIGIEPYWFSNFNFSHQPEDLRYDFPEQVIPRSPDQVRIGMSQKELLQELGSPEFIRRSWDYAITDGQTVFTLRIYWHDRHQPTTDFERYRILVDQEPPLVERIEKIDFPPWNIDPVREYAVAHMDCG